MTWDEAFEALFRAPHGDFVTERKRLAGELKASGDKAGATKLGKVARPPVSAWAVNQAWWNAKPAFDAFLETAKRVRGGDLQGLAAHKAAVAVLVQHAAQALKAIGNAAQDTTLRRVETTLTALAATGTFEPDVPGALTDDRDPPGFLSLGIAPASNDPPPPEPSAPRAPVIPLNAPTAAPPPEDDGAAARAAALKERERREREQAEAERLAAELAAARAELATAEADVERLELELTAARKRALVIKTRVTSLQGDA